MEIAVNGVDGVGKSTFINAALFHFERAEIRVSVIDLPYFRRTHGFSWISPYLAACGEWVETRSRFLFATFMVSMAMLFLFARWRTQRAQQVVIVEHHPRIAMIPYALLYGGRFGLLLASAVRTFWPKPDYLILLTADPRESRRRVVSRGRRMQWRQSAERLLLLQQQHMLEAVKELPRNCIGVNISASKLLESLKAAKLL